MELYQKIEALIGLRMEAYPAEQEAVLLLLERVSDAQRIATMQVGGRVGRGCACWAGGQSCGAGACRLPRRPTTPHACTHAAQMKEGDKGKKGKRKNDDEESERQLGAPSPWTKKQPRR